MAILKDHPARATFKQRGQALALLRRKQQRELTGDEQKKFASNPLLKGLLDLLGQALKDKIAAFEAEQEADAKTLAEAADTFRSVQRSTKEVAAIDAAKAKHGKLSDDELTAAILKIRKTRNEANAALKELAREAQRRGRLAMLLERLGTTSDADKKLLAQVLAPAYLDSKTKVNDAG